MQNFPLRVLLSVLVARTLLRISNEVLKLYGPPFLFDCQTVCLSVLSAFIDLFGKKLFRIDYGQNRAPYKTLSS